MPEVNNRAFIDLGSDIVVRTMYELRNMFLFFLKTANALFSWAPLCLEKVWVCFARKLGIFSFQRERYHSKLRTKASVVNFKVAAFLGVTRVGFNFCVTGMCG